VRLLVAALYCLLASGADAAPVRVVSTNLCGDEYVFRLVPRAHIAALSFEAGDRHPVVSTIADRVGGIAQIRPSTETVLNLKPDLVVMYAGTMAKLHANLTALGVPVLDIPYDNSVADIRRTATMLGDKLGAPGVAAAMLRDMDATLAKARAGAARQSVRTLIYEPNGYATNGGVTTELMSLAGLTDVGPRYSATRQGTVPVETVVAAAPELMILSGQLGTQDTRANLIQHHPALRRLTHTRVEWQPLLPLLCAGPWSADAAITFAELGRKTRLLGKRQARN